MDFDSENVVMVDLLERISDSLERIASSLQDGPIHINIDHGHIEQIEHVDHAHIDDIAEIHGDVTTHPKNF
tara:strand:- start:1406 stop:1618 length:213 start_codon:yes stop_codon:yes gene_type:complete